MYSDLSPKKKRFCELYVVDFNGAKAARDAGYSVATADKKACNLLAEPPVKAYITELKAEQKKRCVISSDYVIEKIKGVVDNCSQDDNYAPQYVLKGAELLGKIIGIFEADNLQKNPAREGLEKLPPETLDMIVNKLKKASSSTATKH